jgi:hypothetical protein
VEGSSEQAYSLVVATDRLLQEAMTMVGRDILHPIQVCYRKGKSLLEFLWFHLGSLMTLPFGFV